MFTSCYQACFEVLEQILKSYGTLLTSYQHLCLMMINNRYAFTCIGAVYYFNFAGTEEVVLLLQQCGLQQQNSLIKHQGAVYIFMIRISFCSAKSRSSVCPLWIIFFIFTQSLLQYMLATSSATFLLIPSH